MVFHAMDDLSIGVVFVTYRARKHLPYCLPPVLQSPLNPRVLVVDSSSYDGTAEMACEMGAETMVIPQREFNHGATREMVRKLMGTDIVVMMTQDAYADSPDFLEKLIAPLRNGKAAVSYARQLPHHGADFFESFAREFNYPDRSEIRSRDDLPRYGSYLYFCSNSCAAWLNSALDEIGGFPHTLTNEDTYAAAKLIASGYRIAYVAEAEVRHSHRYTLVQEFRRYFDTGYVRRVYGKDVLLNQHDEKHGARFFRFMLSRLWRESPELIPYAVLSTATKYLGYRAGYHGLSFPLPVKRFLSGQSYYWK